MKLDKFQEQVFFTTARVSISSDDNNGSSIGTGFLMNVPINNDKNHISLLISNKHVFVNPADNIEFTFNKKNDLEDPAYGNLYTFTGKDFSSIYYEHPDPNIDIACINASIISQPAHNVYYRTLPATMISDFLEDELIPGLDVWFVGYPENRFDVANNLPLLRRGYISSLPKIDYNNKNQFVIDAQVFQGSSGSPVFTSIRGNFKLIGIVSETMIKHGQLEAVPATQTSVGVEQILGLGIVVKANVLKELIDIVVDSVNEKIKIDNQLKKET